MATILNINVSTANDGLGDTLRASQVKANDNFAELNTKKVEVVSGFGLSENNFTDAEQTKLTGIEDGAEVNVQADWNQADPSEDSFILNKPDYLNGMGWFIYNDAATNVTPLSFVTNVDKKLTNDKLGAGTNIAYAPDGVTSLWNSTTNQMDLSELSIGDIVNMRILIEVTTTAVNQSYQAKFKSAIGSPAENYVSFMTDSQKTAGTKLQAVSVQVAVSSIYAQTYPSEFWILSDNNGTIKIKGWYFSIIRKNINLVDVESIPTYIKTRVVTGTSDTLLSSDNGKQIITTNSAAVTVTVPVGFLSGFNCEILQQGTGQVTVVGSGTTIVNSTYELPKTEGQYSLIAIDNVPNLTETYHVYGQLQNI